MSSSGDHGDGDVAQQARSGPTLTDLPSGPLECILTLLTSNEGDDEAAVGASRCAVRRACRLLRKAFDSCNLRLDIGPSPDVEGQGGNLTRSQAAALQSLLLALVRRTPRLATLSMHHDATFVDWADVLHAGGLALRDRLRTLLLSERLDVADLTPVTAFTSLRRLDLAACRGVRDLTPLSALVSLQHLDVHSSRYIKNLTPLSACVALRHLDFAFITNIRSLAPLAHCPALTHVEFNKCTRIATLEPLSELSDLRHLGMGKCTSIQDLAPLELSASALLHLDMSEVRLTKLGPFALCTALQYLTLGAASPQTLQYMGSFHSLRHLSLGNCTNVPHLGPLANCPLLRHLTLKSGSLLEELTPLAWCDKLQELSLTDCTRLVRLQGLSPCTGLARLRLRVCHSLRDLQPLTNLGSLQQLHLFACISITDIRPLSHCTALTDLSLGACQNLVDLRPLSQCAALAELDLVQCTKVTDLTPLSSLTDLYKLKIEGVGSTAVQAGGMAVVKKNLVVMTAPEMIQELGARGLPTHGRRDELFVRLATAPPGV